MDLYCVALCDIVLHCITLYYIILYVIVLYCIVLYYIVLYCIMLYYILYYIILRYAILYWQCPWAALQSLRIATKIDLYTALPTGGLSAGHRKGEGWWHNMTQYEPTFYTCVYTCDHVQMYSNIRGHQNIRWNGTALSLIFGWLRWSVLVMRPGDASYDSVSFKRLRVALDLWCILHCVVLNYSNVY